MSKGHFIDQLSAFVNQELSKEDRQTIAEHLMQCDACRREHDRIRIGSGLAARLEKADAPESTWLNIESDLYGNRAPTLETFAAPRRFDLRHIGAFATAVFVVGLLSFLVYRGLFAGEYNTVAVVPQPPERPVSEVEAYVPNTNQDSATNNSNLANDTGNISSTPTVSVAPIEYAWKVETIAGKQNNKKLAVGEYLETDASSRVRIDVADIGNVEIAPNSRVKLVGTSEKQHRLSLERGSLHAKIAAPPRLFIVDTPSAAAVDLGCEYTLSVDDAGNSKLVVTGGFVALESGGRESIVPAGAACLTRKGRGLGTPFSSEATPEFERALYRFDFKNGGSRAIKEIITHAELYDIVTLWHLLSRVSVNDRPAVFEALSRYVPPPEGVTREAVLSLNKAALERWREAVEIVWFE